MKVALFWPCGEVGKAVLEKFTKCGDFVYAYTDRPDEIKIDSTNYEIERGKMGEPERMERAVLNADVVVCCFDPRSEGARRDPATPYFDGLSNIISVMNKQKKDRVFLTCPVCKFESERGMLRAFCRFFRSFAPQAYRDSCKATALIQESSLNYTIVRFMNPYLKNKSCGYMVSQSGEKVKAGVSADNLAQCIVDAVHGDLYCKQAPVVYNCRQD